MCHAGWPPHRRIGHIALKNIGQTLTAGRLMSEDGGRTLARGPTHFACPHRNAVAHAARHELEPQVSPIGLTQRVVEVRLTVEVVEVGANELAVLHANAGIIDEIGHATRGVDLIVRTARSTRFRLDDLDAILECLLYDNNDARQPRVW